jgi:hypothetical protein
MCWKEEITLILKSILTFYLEGRTFPILGYKVPKALPKPEKAPKKKIWRSILKGKKRQLKYAPLKTSTKKASVNPDYDYLFKILLVGEPDTGEFSI